MVSTGKIGLLNFSGARCKVRAPASPAYLIVKNEAPDLNRALTTGRRRDQQRTHHTAAAIYVSIGLSHCFAGGRAIEADPDGIVPGALITEDILAGLEIDRADLKRGLGNKEVRIF